MSLNQPESQYVISRGGKLRMMISKAEFMTKDAHTVLNSQYLSTCWLKYVTSESVFHNECDKLIQIFVPIVCFFLSLWKTHFEALPDI